MSDDIEELKYNGRILGTHSGWDGDIDIIRFYDFKPATGIQLPIGDLTIDTIDGWISVRANEAVTLLKLDLPTFLASIPRSR